MAHLQIPEKRSTAGLRAPDPSSQEGAAGPPAVPALEALRLALGAAAQLWVRGAFRSRDKTQLDIYSTRRVCGPAGQMASGTKGEARMGAKQIGNFLPFPLS